MSSQLRASPAPDPRRWRALGLLSVAQFLVILDTSIIGVSLPAIWAAGMAAAAPAALAWMRQPQQITAHAGMGAIAMFGIRT
jgi:hypothetical protein